MSQIVSIAGGTRAVGPVSGGKIYRYNALSTVAQVAPANPNRVQITFHSPGPEDVLVAPVTDAMGVAFTLNTTTYGGAFRVYGNGGTLTLQGECAIAWQALTASGNPTPFTVMDSNA